METGVYPISYFDTLRPQWDLLNQQTQCQAILDADFVSSLITHFFRGDEQLVVLYQASQLRFIGFFQRTGFGCWQTVMPSQAPVGLWLASSHSIDETLLQAIAKVLPGPVLQLDLLQADSRNLTVAPAIYQQFYIETGNRPVPAHYEDFASTIGKNLRQNCNKAYNRAEREKDSLSAEVVCSPEQVTAGVIRYGEIESASWKAQEGTAISPDNQQGRFYQQMMTTLAQRGAACVWFFKVSGNIAAVDLCVIKNGNLIILKTTFDEQYARYSPALLLKLEILKYYAANPQLGINNIEFYGKAMDWHKRLNSELRPIVHLSWQRTRLLQWLVRQLKQYRARRGASKAAPDAQV